MDTTTSYFLDIARHNATAGESTHIISLQSPMVAEVLGKSLASALMDAEPDTVIVWDQVETSVLGHVVARELGTDLVYAFSVEGSLGLSAPLARGALCVLISYDWTEAHGLDALRQLTESSGGTISGIGAITPVENNDETVHVVAEPQEN